MSTDPQINNAKYTRPHTILVLTLRSPISLVAMAPSLLNALNLIIPVIQRQQSKQSKDLVENQCTKHGEFQSKFGSTTHNTCTSQHDTALILLIKLPRDTGYIHGKK